jgi:hypothetical protein
VLNRLVNWHRAWEDEILAVLADPSLAGETQSGYRRRTAEKLAKMSAIERRQLREFSVAYCCFSVWSAQPCICSFQPSSVWWSRWC